MNPNNVKYNIIVKKIFIVIILSLIIYQSFAQKDINESFINSLIFNNPEESKQFFSLHNTGNCDFLELVLNKDTSSADIQYEINEFLKFANLIKAKKWKRTKDFQKTGQEIIERLLKKRGTYSNSLSQIITEGTYSSQNAIYAFALLFKRSQIPFKILGTNSTPRILIVELEKERMIFETNFNSTVFISEKEKLEQYNERSAIQLNSIEQLNYLETELDFTDLVIFNYRQRNYSISRAYENILSNNKKIYLLTGNSENIRNQIDISYKSLLSNNELIKSPDKWSKYFAEYVEFGSNKDYQTYLKNLLTKQYNHFTGDNPELEQMQQLYSALQDKLKEHNKLSVINDFCFYQSMAHFNLSKEKKFSEAISFYKKAHKIEPNNRHIWDRLCRSVFELCYYMTDHTKSLDSLEYYISHYEFVLKHPRIFKLFQDRLLLVYSYSAEAPEQIINKLTKLTRQYPEIKNNAKIAKIIPENMLRIASINISRELITEGEKNISEFIDYMRKEKLETFTGSRYIHSAFGNLAAYYVRKKKYTDAMRVLSLGLKTDPGNSNFAGRLNRITETYLNN